MFYLKKNPHGHSYLRLTLGLQSATRDSCPSQKHLVLSSIADLIANLSSLLERSKTVR